MITINAADAAARGLPAIGMRIDPEAAPMIISTFAQPGQYLIASGPPGGALLFEVWAADEQGADAAAVRRVVESRFNRPALVPTVWGPEGTLTVSGTTRPAVAFLSDKGMFQTGWCAALVPHAAGTLLVTLARGVGASAKTTTCDEVSSHSALAALLKSLVIVDA